MVKKRIVITGGHLTPAVAVIDELIRRGGWEIFFFGRKYAAEGEKTPSVESEIISQKRIWFIPLRAGRFQRRFSWQTLPALLRFPLGFFQAFWHLLRIRPVIILSFGGYLSVPVILAGWLLRIPSVTHEQTAVLGLATRINAFLVEKIAISWPQISKYFPPEKVVLTGNPIRKEIFGVSKKMWQALNFPKRLPLILVTGGNQGSHLINQAVEKSLPQLVKIANVFHQSGHLLALGDFERLEQLREELPQNFKNRYHVKKYLSGEEMGTLLGKADLVISRAGANITTEIAALGKPALFIPIPWSHADEQRENARMLKEKGLAEILLQEELSPKTLIQLIKRMMTNLDGYKKNAAKAKRLVKLDAAERIAALLEPVVK